MPPSCPLSNGPRALSQAVTPMKKENIDKDLEVLRKEYTGLTKSLTRLSYIRIAVLFLFAFAFASASSKINSVDNAQIQAISDQLNNDLQKNLKLNFQVDPGQFIGGSCPADTGARLRSPKSNSTVDASQYVQLIRKLCDLYNAAFTFPVDLFGTKVELDLRNWIYVLPILYWFSAVYFCLLRMKCKSIAWLAGRSVQSDSTKVSTLDSLLFSGDLARGTEYARIPWQFLSIFLSLFTVSIFVYFAVVTAPFWTKLDDSVFYQLGHVVVIFSLLTGVYVAGVRGRLEDQIQGQPGCLSGMLQSYWRKSTASIWALLKKSKLSGLLQRFPNAYLTSGAILMLVTLGLGISLGGCDSYEGYKLVFWKKYPPWSSGDIYTLSDWGRHLHLASVLASYLISLALAVVTLVLILVSIRYRGVWNYRKLTGPIFVISAGIGGSLLAQLGYLYSMTANVESPALPALRFVWILNSAAIFIMWCRFTFGAAYGNVRWPSVSLLVILYVPLLPAAWTLVWFATSIGEEDNLVGNVVWTVAIHLLAIGYVLRLREARAPQAPDALSQRMRGREEGVVAVDASTPN